MFKLILTGYVGKDPESRADKSGSQFITFSVGVSIGTKQAPKTTWVEISCNGKLADIARNYVKKGAKILVEGFPSSKAYKNREGEPVASLRVNANNIEFLSSSNPQVDDAQPANYSLPDQQPVLTSHTLSSDDIPFNRVD